MWLKVCEAAGPPVLTSDLATASYRGRESFEPNDNFRVVAPSLHRRPYRLWAADRAGRLASTGFAQAATFAAHRLHCARRGSLLVIPACPEAAADVVSAGHRTLHRVRCDHRAYGGWPQD